MAQPSPSNRRALILVVSDGEWAGRSFESVLESHGYRVQRVTSGHEALVSAQSTPPDAIIIDEHLADMRAARLTAALREGVPYGRALPIIVTSSSPPSPRERMQLYEAGAWDYCSQPLDVEVLMLKLRTFVEAREEVSALEDQMLIDSSTDMYNLRGMRRWSRELAARAVRRHEPLAAIAFTPAGSALRDSTHTDRAWRKTLEFVERQRRASDVVGYIGDATFAVLAPDTDATAATHFIDRLQLAAANSGITSGKRAGEVALSVGYWASGDLSGSQAIDDDLVGRATAALSHVRRTRLSGVVRFDDIPS